MPTLLAAAPLRIPVVLWEGNVVPGRAVRYDGPARPTRSRSPTRRPAGRSARRSAPCYVTGTPIRDVDGDRRARTPGRGSTCPPDARVDPDLRRLAGRRGGSTPRSPRRCRGSSSACHVLHVAGEDGYAAALAERERLPAGRCAPRYRPYPFLREEMLPALVAADLVVGRAGSSTLAEVTALGIPSVIVPYPHAARPPDARTRRVLADAGAARVVADEAFDADALVAAADLLRPTTTPRAPAMADGGPRPRPARRRRRGRRAGPGRSPTRRPLPARPTRSSAIARGAAA